MPVRRSMKARAHIHKNDAGYYWFNILSANNRVVATSEIYTRKASAIKTAEIRRQSHRQDGREEIMSGWIGVDFDGTLSKYEGWADGQLGPPVPRMLERVKGWLAEGKEVRIFTARVGACGDTNSDSGLIDGGAFAEEQRALIEAWCEKHLGRKLRVTASKDFAMLELWDDRAIQVQFNTGEVLS